jgi:multidrug resistance efflux pump
MSAAEEPILTSVPVQPVSSVHEVQPQPAPEPRGKPWWQKLAVPAVVSVLTASIVVTITRNWNAWEGGRIQQITDDAFVRGDVTPLNTKVAGIVKGVKVSDYQKVQKGDLLVALEATRSDPRLRWRQASAANYKAKADLLQANLAYLLACGTAADDGAHPGNTRAMNSSFLRYVAALLAAS